MLALKGNQKTSMESALSYMSDATRENLPGLTVHETNDAAHGRKEKRTCRTCQDIGKFPGLENLKVG